jgi:hypothetical protein
VCLIYVLSINIISFSIPYIGIDVCRVLYL